MPPDLIDTLSENRKPLGLLAVVAVLAAGISLFSGGGPTIETVPVSGIVTLNGEPVANVVVNFEPALDSTIQNHVTAQPGSFGLTDEAGRYELAWSQGMGAVSGTHRVVLIWKDSERQESAAEHDPAIAVGNAEDIPLELAPVFLLPESARDGSLRFTVPENGTDSADFKF